MLRLFELLAVVIPLSEMFVVWYEFITAVPRSETINPSTLNSTVIRVDWWVQKSEAYRRSNLLAPRILNDGSIFLFVLSFSLTFYRQSVH